MAQDITDVKEYMQQVGQQARQPSRLLAAANTGAKNDALLCIYDKLKQAKPEILAANKIDMQNGHDNNLDAALLDR